MGNEPLGHRVVQFTRQPGPLLEHRRLPAPFVQPLVAQGDRGVRGEEREQFLVAVGELPRPLVRHEDDAEHLRAAPHRHPEEPGHFWMRGGPAFEPGVRPDVRQPFRRAGLQQRGQHPVLPWQRADRALPGLGNPVGHELGERAPVVGHAERGVPRVHQRPRGPHDRRERVPRAQRAAHRQHGLADRAQFREIAFHPSDGIPAGANRDPALVLRPSDGARRARRPMRCPRLRPSVEA